MYILAISDRHLKTIWFSGNKSNDNHVIWWFRRHMTIHMGLWYAQSSLFLFLLMLAFDWLVFFLTCKQFAKWKTSIPSILVRECFLACEINKKSHCVISHGYCTCRLVFLFLFLWFYFQFVYLKQAYIHLCRWSPLENAHNKLVSNVNDVKLEFAAQRRSLTFFMIFCL